MAKERRFKTWSYSRFADYKNCPAMAAYKHLDKLGDNENDAMLRGIEVHEDGQKYVEKEVRKVPEAYSKFEAEMKFLREISKHVKCEGSIVLTRDWRHSAKFKFPTTDDDGEVIDWGGPWSGRDAAWLIMKTDVEYIDPDDSSLLFIIDYKTGKKRPHEHKQQLELYAIAGFIKYPDVEVVKAGMWYLDYDDDLEEQFVRSDMKDLIKSWEKAVKPMFADRTFAPNPDSWSCRVCQFAKGRGGPCKFGPDKKQVAAWEKKKGKR